MTFQSQSPLDATDWRILRELQGDSRLSYNELGRRVALSAPAVAERIRKLEDRGIITGYTAQVDPAKVGLPLLVFIQLRCDHGKCLLKTSSADVFPEIQEMHKLSGDHCTMIKAGLSSMQHLEAFKDRLSQHGRLVCNVVTSSVITHRTVDWENPDVNMDPPNDPGWTQ